MAIPPKHLTRNQTSPPLTVEETVTPHIMLEQVGDVTGFKHSVQHTLILRGETHAVLNDMGNGGNLAAEALP